MTFAPVLVENHINMKTKVIIFLICGFLFLIAIASVWTNYKQEWKQYQRTFFKMQASLTKTEEEKKAILRQKIEIKRISMQQNEADLCMTCHLGLEDPRFKKAPQPFKTHPGKNRHPFEKFGCTICHLGQGQATSKDEAHGRASTREKPVLSKEEVQSSCSHCHEQIYIEDGNVISRGKELFISLGCHGCHKAKGYESLYKVAPDLKKIGNKIDHSWLVRWIKNPKKYQPHTRMPTFRMSEEEAIAIAAYLISQSDPNYHEPIQYDKGDANAGKKLFRTIGCLGCHKMGKDSDTHTLTPSYFRHIRDQGSAGEGNDFAPNLSHVGDKVKPDWLVNWFLDPKGYNPRTIMPKFRLSIQEAKDISAFILTVGTKHKVPKFEEEILSPEKIKQGKELIEKRGCAACHDINGIEHKRIGPELSNIGAKLPSQLDFGNTSSQDVERSWFAWIKNKLENPAVFDTELKKSKMPSFNLPEDDIKALAIFLKGLDDRVVPGNFIKKLSVRGFEIEQGRKAIVKYNCRGCHRIDGQGGGILKFYKGKYYAPPPLEMGGLHVGDRLKDSWMYSFLRKPVPVREWLKVKMPTFMLDQGEIYYITRYFVNFAKDKIPYERGIRDIPPDNYLIKGRKLVLAFECEECHDEKNSRGPKFSLMSKRLRKNWAKNWLKNTRTLYPGTKMPEHWPIKNGKHVVLSKFPKARDMMGGDVDKQINAIWEYIANYNEKPFLDIELPGEPEEDEDILK